MYLWLAVGRGGASVDLEWFLMFGGQLAIGRCSERPQTGQAGCF